MAVKYCKGCETDLDNCTIGCQTCSWRRQRRSKQQDPGWLENANHKRRERRRRLKGGGSLVRT